MVIQIPDSMQRAVDVTLAAQLNRELVQASVDDTFVDAGGLRILRRISIRRRSPPFTRDETATGKRVVRYTEN